MQPPTIGALDPTYEAKLAADRAKLTNDYNASNTAKLASATPFSNGMNPYTINAGEDLWTIAQKYGTTPMALMNLNPNVKGAKTDIGQTINLGLKPAVGGNTTQNIISTPTTGTNKTPYIGSSAPVVNAENDAKLKFQQMTSDFDSGKDAQDAIEEKRKLDELFKQQQANLQAQTDAEVAAINVEQDNLINNAKTDQQKEVATQIVGLARIGGYLGGSASSMGAMNQLKATHDRDIAKLEANRRALINEAKVAAENRNYKAMEQYRKDSQAIKDNIDKRRTEFFSQMDKLSDDIRETTKFAQDQANKTLDMIAESGEEATVDQVSAFAKALGTTPDVIAGLITAKKNSKALETLKDKTSIQAQIFNMMDNVPAGQYFTGPDGKQYAGTKKAAGSGDGTGEKKTQYSEAEKYVQNNYNTMSQDKLNSELRRLYPSLPDGDITAILKTNYLIPDEKLTKITTNYLSDYDDTTLALEDFEYDLEEKEGDAKNLTPAQADQVRQKIQAAKVATPEKKPNPIVNKIIGAGKTYLKSKIGL